jgi:hypothetical protein
MMFLLVLGKRMELHLDEMMLVALGSAMAVRHVRMLFVFGILVAPVVSRQLAKWWDSYDFARDRRSPNVAMIALSLVIVWFAFPSSRQLQAQVRSGNPIGAVEFIQREGLSGRMLNDYNYGGYLIWALPQKKVFVDGRADVYEWTGVLQDFADWATLQVDPNVLLEKYGIDFCLLTRHSPMSKVLPYLPGWKKAYSDDDSVVFVRRGSSTPPGFRASTAN